MNNPLEALRAQHVEILKGWRDEYGVRAGFSMEKAALEAAIEALATPGAGPVDGVSGRWCPDKCPVTGREFFCWIGHPNGGDVPTYGGPFDSYTLPVREDDGTFTVERFDHDRGAWVDSEGVGLRLCDDQHEDYEFGTVDDLKARITALEATPAPVAVESDAVAWTVFDAKGIRFTLYNRELADAIAARGLLVLPMLGCYEWLDTKADTWKPIDRLPHTWERELGIQWRSRAAPESVRAINLLVAAGYVTDATVNEALCIAHGFAPGPLPTPQAAAQVSDAMFARAVEAQEEYWQDTDHVTTCETCKGRGEDAGDWCGDCGGAGELHAGTEDGALRAALTAALRPSDRAGEV